MCINFFSLKMQLSRIYAFPGLLARKKKHIFATCKFWCNSCNIFSKVLFTELFQDYISSMKRQKLILNILEFKLNCENYVQKWIEMGPT